jgi:hypothetical protein
VREKRESLKGGWTAANMKGVEAIESRRGEMLSNPSQKC